MALKISTYSNTTDAITGLVTLNIQIPGTFGGMNIQTPGFQGRRLVRMALWLENRASQDKLTQLSVTDNDSILPAPFTGATISNLIDQSVPSGNRFLSLPPGGLPFVLDFPTDPNNPGYPKTIIPSQVYIVATFAKAIVGVDRAVVNIAWDDFT